MDKNQKQTEINKYEKFMHWLWRQKSITELVLNIGMDGIAKKYVKERVSANNSHDAPAALPLYDVVGRSKLLKTKFTVGQKVIVCGELNATITRIEDDKYWFKDDDGKDWFESENAITAV